MIESALLYIQFVLTMCVVAWRGLRDVSVWLYRRVRPTGQQA